MYSQGKEEEVILNYFKDRKGVFLSIGENDGITFSNVRQLAKNGWGGVCVEPSPSAFYVLSNLYKHNSKVDIINRAISTERGVVDFYDSGEHLGIGDTSLLSTINKDEVNRWKGTKNKFNLISCSCITFDDIFLGTDYKKFNFISIDIEGSELSILPMINFELLKTEMLCVEWNSKDKDKYNSIITPFGLKLIFENNENLIYAK